MTKRAGDDVVSVLKGPRALRSPMVRRRARREREYARWRDGELVVRFLCQACPRVRHDGVTFRATTLHHRRLRRQGGAWVSRLNTLAVCEGCHTWIHANVAVAKVFGFLVGVDSDEWVVCGVEETSG